MRQFITLREKRNIVHEAYSTPLNVSRIARKYNVQPTQIKRWSKIIEVPNFNAETRLTKKTVHGGQKPLHADIYPVLKFH